MFIILGADGKEYGPVTAGKIHEWIIDGRANLQTQARRVGETQWKALVEFEDFGQAGLHPVRPAAVPQPIRSPVPEVEPVAEVVTPPLASRWLRLPASMIDGLLKTLAYLPVTLPLARFMVNEAMSGEKRSFHEISQLTTEVVNTHIPDALPWLLLLVLVQLGLLAWRGQSVGKLILGLHIVRQRDGDLPGLYRAFLLRGTLPFMIEQIPVVGFVFWVVDSCFIFRADRRCVHDLIAGTIVVKR